MAEKPPTSRFFPRPQFRTRESTKRARVRKKMRYFALRSNFIIPLPLLLLHPARLTIASHNIFLRTLKRGCVCGQQTDSL